MQATAVAPASARPCSTSGRRAFGGHAAAAAAAPVRQRRQRSSLVAHSSKVELRDLDGTVHVLDVPDSQNVLEVALDQGLDVPYDCKMGVCLRCSAKIESGSVEQPGGMISEECMAQGYALMCVAYPQSDCVIRVIPEEELVDAVMEIA